VTGFVHSDRRRSSAVVLKLGSSVLTDIEGMRRAAVRIGQLVRGGQTFICVVSAVGSTTDRLLQDIRALHRSASGVNVAAALATGEDSAAALLGIALHAEGVESRVARAGSFRIRTTGARLDARPVGLNRVWLTRAMETVPVVIVPGFVGACRRGRPAVLGRGGSDLSALFIAHELGIGECQLVKDVPGLYAWDPNDVTLPTPQRLREASWGDARRLGSQLVQPKAVRYAERREQRFSIVDLHGRGTLVGPGPSVVEGSYDDCTTRSRCA